MTFADLVEHDTILYTYEFSSTGLATTIGNIIRDGKSLELEDTYTTIGGKYTTSVSTMLADSRATIIAKVASVEDAKLHYPELFI